MEGVREVEGSPARLHEMTWEDIEAVLKERDPVVIIPIGSVEQHGRHLPLGTDTHVAIDLAEAAAGRVPGAVVTPPVWYGMSSHHMVLPGTVTVRPGVLIELTIDIISSLRRHGFRKFVLLNGHRISNLPWMQLACERLNTEAPDCRTAIFDPAYMSREIAGELDFGPVGHADELETSHMLACRPDLCRMDRAEDYRPTKRQLYHVDPRASGDTLAYVPSSNHEAREIASISGGTTGEPTRANVQKGQEYRDHLLMRLVQVIEDM